MSSAELPRRFLVTRWAFGEATGLGLVSGVLTRGSCAAVRFRIAVGFTSGTAWAFVCAALNSAWGFAVFAMRAGIGEKRCTVAPSTSADSATIAAHVAVFQNTRSLAKGFRRILRTSCTGSGR